MVDETPGVPQSDITAEQPEKAPNRSLWGLVGLLAATIIVILMLLMIPRCQSSAEQPTGRKGKTIVVVPRYEPLPGAVSVWLSDSTNLSSALAGARVRSDGSVNMGGGRWVVMVREGSEDRAVAALKAEAGVHDAGRVYEDGK